MKLILTYSEYNALKEMWKHSTSAYQMLFSLPQQCLASVRTGLRNFVEELLNQTADQEEIDQFKDDCKSAEIYCEQRIRDRHITRNEADREIADAMWWKAIYELQFQEHLDVALARKLREFVNTRDILEVFG